MPVLTLVDLQSAIRASWCPESIPLKSRSAWDPDNPSREQCGVTALVVNDLLGGDLVVGEVHVDGAHVDYHWWNRFGAVDIDLTREQFEPREVVVGGRAMARPPDAELRRAYEEYRLLRSLVLARLGIADEPAADDVGSAEAG